MAVDNPAESAPPLGDRDLSEFCQLGLRLGAITLEVVRAWGDHVLVTRVNPPPWAIELSVADIADAISVLNAVKGELTSDLPTRLVIALVRRRWRRGQLSLEDVKNIGWQLHASDMLESEAAGDWGVELFCEYEEFEQGFRVQAQMRTSVEEKLAPYSKYDQYLPAWADPDFK